MMRSELLSEYELGVGNGTLTSVTGWAGYEYNDDVDVDWLPLQFIDRSDIHDFEQLAKKFAGPQT